MTINKDAQEIINRIAKVMEVQPSFNLQKVTQNFTRHYELLNVPMPKIEVAKDMVIGYEIAWDAARGAAWDAARDAARDAAWDAARGAARGAAWGAAWDAAWDAARDAAWDAAWDAARDAAWDAARGAARDAAWDAARGAAAINTNLKDQRVIRFIEIETELLKALENGLGFYFPMRDKLILVPMPKMRVDERKRLHSLDKPAVDWHGGVKFHFINGVRFEKKLWKKITDKTISAKEVLSLSNIEQRMAALRVVGVDIVLENAKLVDHAKGYELFEVEKVFSRTAYFLKYKDPSTDRVYVSGIDPSIGAKKSAIRALEWKFTLDEGDTFDEES